MILATFPQPSRPLADLLASGSPVLMEGAVVERVRRGAPNLLDPILMNAPLVYTEAGQALLGEIYGEYLSIGRKNGLPLLSLTPTWRTNPDRIRQSAYAARDINGDSVRFLQGLRRTCGDYAAMVYIGGLMGCRGDAYKPQEALCREAARDFHIIQASSLVKAGVDFLFASTMPDLQEALGMAEAFATTGCPYLVSFIVRPTGCLLDGTPLDEAITRLDDQVGLPPLGYLVNCVHSSTLESALHQPGGRRALATGRLLGLQANTSSKSPEELDGAEELVGEAPERFAEGMAHLHQCFGLRLLGGCCGTDASHMAALAASMAQA